MVATDLTAQRAEELAEDRTTYGLFSIGSARGDLIRAMAYLDMPQTRGAQAIIAQAIDLLEQAKSEVGR